MPDTAPKRCSMCGESKPLDEFNRDRAAKDGRQGRCRACSRAGFSAWNAANPELRKARNKRYREAHRERCKTVTREWQKANPDRVDLYQKRLRKRHPEKVSAWNAVNNAVRDGRITKPDTCVDCGELTESRLLHAHHTDYSKPLGIEWLCKDCHWDRHR